MAATVKVGRGPLGVAITTDGRFVYVANRQPFGTVARGDISVIDTDSLSIVATVSVGDNPTFVTIEPVARCIGDCNADGAVTVNELVTGVDMALALEPLAACPAFDADGDHRVTVNEVVEAVNDAATGCVDAAHSAGEPKSKAYPSCNPIRLVSEIATDGKQVDAYGRLRARRSVAAGHGPGVA